MANQIGPRGLVPSRYLDGSAWNGATNMYCIPLADGSIYGPGDVVKSAAGGDANGIPYVQKALGTDTIRGVIVSVVLAAPNLPSTQGVILDNTTQAIPAAKVKDYYVLVADDPTIVFEVQDNGNSALTSSACNKNASLIIANPTAPQQNSATSLSTASVATTQGLNFKIMGLVQKPNNAYGVYASWLVRANQHELGGSNTAGV
jgi:hypothetical protein